MKNKKNKSDNPKNKGKRAKNKFTALFSPRYRYVILTLILDIALVFGSFWLAHFSIYYSDSVANPSNYKQFFVPLMLVSVTVPICMLALFDCYNVVWKYAEIGRASCRERV